MVPHKFAVLFSRTRPTDLIAGAGLSFGLVKLAAELFATRRDDVESVLHLAPVVPPAGKTLDLHTWADAVLAQLSLRGGEPPKLRLARALGVLDHAQWLGRVSIPLPQVKPRHRVIARFAREGLWRTIWSLNWDCHIENALEAVGLENSLVPRNEPWITKYCTVVTGADINQKLGNPGHVCVLKPHGCARSMVRAEREWAEGSHPRAIELTDRFLIGATELVSRTTSTDEMFFVKLQADLHSGALLAFGWRANEPYLAKVIAVALARVAAPQAEDLSVVDVLFNGEGHAALATYFKLPQAQVFFDVSKAVGFDADELMLWVQARYFLDRVAKSSGDPITKAAVEARLALLIAPNVDVFAVGWADLFLPAWVRLCWRAGLVAYAGHETHKLALEQADEHIPLFMGALPRPDLAAAAVLLSWLAGSPVQWDAVRFPGALWHEDSFRLLIPVPAWGTMDTLSALRPMLKEFNFALVRQVVILPVPPNQGSALDGSLRAHLTEMVARLLSSAGLAVDIGVGTKVDLTQQGGVNA